MIWGSPDDSRQPNSLEWGAMTNCEARCKFDWLMPLERNTCRASECYDFISNLHQESTLLMNPDTREGKQSHEDRWPVLLCAKWDCHHLCYSIWDTDVDRRHHQRLHRQSTILQDDWRHRHWLWSRSGAWCMPTILLYMREEYHHVFNPKPSQFIRIITATLVLKSMLVSSWIILSSFSSKILLSNIHLLQPESWNPISGDGIPDIGVWWYTILVILKLQLLPWEGGLSISLSVLDYSPNHPLQCKSLSVLIFSFNPFYWSFLWIYLLNMVNFLNGKIFISGIWSTSNAFT